MSGKGSLTDDHEPEREHISNSQFRPTDSKGLEDNLIRQDVGDSAQRLHMPPPKRLREESEEDVKVAMRKLGHPGGLPRAALHAEKSSNPFSGQSSPGASGSSKTAVSSLQRGLSPFPMAPSRNHIIPNKSTIPTSFQHRDFVKPSSMPDLSRGYSMQSSRHEGSNFGGDHELSELLEEQKRSEDDLKRILHDIDSLDGDPQGSGLDITNLMSNSDSSLPFDRPKSATSSSLIGKMLLDDLKKKSISGSSSVYSQNPKRLPSSAQRAMAPPSNREPDPNSSSKCICGKDHSIEIPLHRCNIRGLDFERPILNDSENNLCLRLLTWLDFASFDFEAKKKRAVSKQEMLEAALMEHSLTIEPSDAATEGTDKLMAGIARGFWTVQDVVPAFTRLLLHGVDCCLLVTFAEEQVQAMRNQACHAFTVFAYSAEELSSIVATLDLDLPDHSRIHNNYHQDMDRCLLHRNRLSKHKELLDNCKQAWEKRARSFQFVSGIMSSKLFKDPENFPDISSKIRSNYNDQLDKLLSERIVIDEGQGVKHLE